MKKLLVVLCLSLGFTACNPFNMDEVVNEVPNPFREYPVIEKEVVEEVERGILDTEVGANGIIKEKSSAHVISLKKVGTYASGEVRILGTLTPEKQKELGMKTDIMNYTCRFEYSYKTKRYSWLSDFPKF